MQGVPCPTFAGWETVGAVETVELVVPGGELGTFVIVRVFFCGIRGWRGEKGLRHGAPWVGAQ